MPSIILLLVVAAQRLLELRIAKRNEAWARSRGAKEYGREHYWMFFVLHPLWMLAFTLEGYFRDAPVQGWAVVAYLILQLLRYSVISTLGPYWNTRILIVPGGQKVTGGLYRFLKHPNYVVVALEILITPLVVGAWWTALVFSVLNALVMRVRIPAEERALREYEGLPRAEGRGPRANR
ncbi:isoprenylcysteine carboxyl methyltransferase family protein [Deinococcus cellulosilyticus]|uniref:Isoprenylcysteine carboxyl methyltransferase n=1 Tax=Deinococcus cellulosilyticus (strain DSM 18568 / NBRC 106333 / KACC 11606 / 5516J-15) TaxID=1223518 RepID=A0A511N108_DEIC1|nr:isoprenylcysteine carboxylmethyltransferase family protein [Deinococcus cellulosilyticus]GEM46489.1 isoprenylcysteine carboxyl methyltransferase [Deinococcus cellulosilyticus NBRC 106333 = KACC 11606]